MLMILLETVHLVRILSIARDLVLQYCKGFRDSGILPVMKHFPGHGRSLVDTHLEPSEVDVA